MNFATLIARLRCRIGSPRLVPLLSLATVALVSFPGVSPAAEAKEPPRRLKRSESFLGIHFDFHAGPDCRDVGKNTTPAMVHRIIDLVKPDYLQIDCKGHPGYSSYPTRVGHPVPGFVGDPLRVWRDVTAARGVALYLHYSGVWDSRAIELNPDWAARTADDSTNGNATSVFGPYADRLLIPQLRELAGDYGVDGVWVDGECWATVPDYGTAARQAFQRATGFDVAPRRASEPHWFEWMEFQREAFRRYLRHYLAEVNRTHPDFEIASNWAFSDHMPEPVSAPVAFLSGDFSPQNSVNSARFSARCLANQGKPWDLMAWSFANVQKGPRQQKSALQLQREAALVLAQGGGFQAYYTQRRDGSVDLDKLQPMGEVAKFCRDRQALAHRATVVPQIALLYSRASHYRQSPQLFTPNSPAVRSLRATLETLVEAQQCVQIVSEHHLHGRLAEWPLVVLPECQFLEPDFRQELLDYARNGGAILALGPRCAAHLATAINVAPSTTAAVRERVTLEFQGRARDASALWQAVPANPKVASFGTIRSAAAPTTAPAATVTRVGRGQIAAVWVNLSELGSDRTNAVARQLLTALTDSLFPQRPLRVTGTADVDVSLVRQGARTIVHLVNTSGPHASEPFVDSLAAVGPVEVQLRLPQRPQRVTVEPGHAPLPFSYADGVVTTRIAQVAVHQMVVVE